LDREHIIDREHKEGKLEGVEVFIVGSGVTIVRLRLSDEQRRRRMLLRARSSSGGGVPAEADGQAVAPGEAAVLRGRGGPAAVAAAAGSISGGGVPAEGGGGKQLQW
jgi:hypothetical protein